MLEEEILDYYKILGIQQNSSQDEIKKAYKKLAMLYHPDKNIEKQEKYVEYFRLISEAYEVLSDEEKKRNYDSIYISQRFLSQMRGKYNLHQSVNHPQKMYRDLSNPSEYDIRSCFVNGKRTFRKSEGISFRTFKNMKDKEFQNPSKNKSYNEDSYNDFLNDMGDDGVSKSTSKYTKNVNGVSVVIVRTTITKRDGSKEIRQQTIDEMGSTTKLYSLGVGQTYKNKALN